MAGIPQRAAPSRKQRAQTDPAAQTLDKLGLVLTILVFLGALASILWIDSDRGLRDANTSFFGSGRPESTHYNAAASSANVTAVFSTGVIASGDGKVDTAFLNVGANKGIYVGDKFTASTGDKETIYFIVEEVYAETCRARIHHHYNLAADAPVTLGETTYTAEELSYSALRLNAMMSSTVSRTWDEQDLRKAVHTLR